jgi:hypothetical protein
MKTARRKRSDQTDKVDDTALTTFSSDLLTPEEERELLQGFWDCKSELVRVLLRHFPTDLRAARPSTAPRTAAKSPPSAASATATFTTSIGSPAPTSGWRPTSPSGSATTPSPTVTCCKKPSAG